MSQQIPTDNGKPYKTNEMYTRRLFMQTGFGYKEIANSKGVYEDEYGISHVVARIVEEYTPPTPSVKIAEVKVSSGPSRLHTGGKSTYKISLRLIFPDKISYNDFIFLYGNDVKYYDEKGNIYTGTFSEAPTVKMVEAGNRYDVKVNIIVIKKEYDDREAKVEFTDLSQGLIYTLTCYRNNSAGLIKLTFQDINMEAEVLIPSGVSDNEVAQIIARYLILFEYENYYTVKVTDNKVFLMPVSESYNGDIIFDKQNTDVVIDITKSGGVHWAKEIIENCTRLGLVTQYDANGNLVYTFSPNSFATRSHMAAFMNRLRKYVERILRG